jgi:predicted secreted acid phosphatase
MADHEEITGEDIDRVYDEMRDNQAERQANEEELKRLAGIEDAFKEFGKVVYSTCKCSKIITANEFLMRVGKLYGALENKLNNLNYKQEAKNGRT